MASLAPTPPLLDPAATAAAIELLPIAAAMVRRSGDAIGIFATNQTYRMAGLDTESGRATLLGDMGVRVIAFLESDDLRCAFAWTTGDAIDCRYFTATLSRTTRDQRAQCLVTLIDDTSRRHTERSLHREMTTDSLTGLPNRQGFGDLIEAAVAEPGHGAHAVLVVDLDRFGRFNACLGSLSGDELLISVARRIRGALRARDTLARIGGDEFGIFLAIDEDPEEAEQVARRIRHALVTPFRLSDYEIRVECSIGIAFGNAGDGDGDGDAAAGEELIRHAQFAVNRAKMTGNAEAYQVQAFTAMREQFAIETQLRRAIENGDLTLAFQPICDLSTGRIACFEALARWRDGDGRDVSPAQFIAVAEESGLIVPLGRWALGEATRTLAAWDAAAGGCCGVQVAVNLSPIQLQRDGIVGVVGDALARSGLAGDRLKLELTESALVADPERTARTMRALKDLGTTLAMDDFGTGYSNLAHLQALPIDILKIDRSFVTGMLADRDKLAIVRAVLSLAQALNMRTVAEGIETNALAQTLAALGCTMGQGFLFARPLAGADAYAMIAPPSA